MKARFSLSSKARVSTAIRENKCIIRSNSDIKIYLIKRMEELNLTYNDVIDEARKKKLKITRSTFSRWLNTEKYEAGTLTQKQILYLCKRYGIDLDITLIYKEIFDDDMAYENASKFLATFNVKY